MRSDLSRSLAVAGAAGLVSSGFVDFHPGWSPVDYPLFGLVQEGHARSFLWSLALLLTGAALAALVSIAARSRRLARYAAYTGAGVVVHWFVLTPIHHGAFPTSVGIGVWLALGGSALVALAAVLPATDENTGGRYHGGGDARAQQATARNSAVWMLEQLSNPSRR